MRKAIARALEVIAGSDATIAADLRATIVTGAGRAPTALIPGAAASRPADARRVRPLTPAIW